MPGVDLENRSALYDFMEREDDRPRLLYEAGLRLATQTVRMIVHPEGNRRIEVFERRDGTFGFEELEWLQEENCWCPLGQRSICITDTLEQALAEARGRIAWLEQLFSQP